jgi:hypothetical protein
MQSFQDKSESEISGDAFDANEALLTALGSCIAATTSDDQIKRRGTTLTIATPFVGSVILSGKLISTVIIKLGSSLSSAKPVAKRLNVVHVPSSSSARSSKRKSLKN